jgi:hypothetical protein
MNPCRRLGQPGGFSLLLVLAYEVHAHLLGRRTPTHQARFVNARMRMRAWVQAMSAQPGIRDRGRAGAAQPADVGHHRRVHGGAGADGVADAGRRLAGRPGHCRAEGMAPLHVRAGRAGRGLLFASYVCSAMSMRYYGNATLILSMPVASAERPTMNLRTIGPFTVTPSAWAA